MRTQLRADLERAERRQKLLFAQALDCQALNPWIEANPAAFAAAIKSAIRVIALAKTLDDDDTFFRECDELLELADHHPEARALFVALVHADREHPDGDLALVAARAARRLDCLQAEWRQP